MTARKKTKKKITKKNSPKGSRATKTPSSKAKLLSGGNPQIEKGDGDAVVQKYINAMPGWKKKIGQRLDAIIEETIPEVQKAVRWNSPFYGMKGNGWFLTFHCFTKYIKIAFLRGQALNPLPPIASKDPNARYFHIYENEKIDENSLTNWIKQSSKVPGDFLF